MGACDRQPATLSVGSGISGSPGLVESPPFCFLTLTWDWLLLLSACTPEAQGGPSCHTQGVPPAPPSSPREKTAGGWELCWTRGRRAPQGLWSMQDTVSGVLTCCFPSPTFTPPLWEKLMPLLEHVTQASANHGSTFPRPQGLVEEWAPDPVRANERRGALAGPRGRDAGSLVSGARAAPRQTNQDTEPSRAPFSAAIGPAAAVARWQCLWIYYLI